MKGKKTETPTEAFDFFGNKIEVGSTVAFMQKGYRNFVEGVVVKITQQCVFISHEKTNTYDTETKQLHAQVLVKITNN